MRKKKEDFCPCCKKYGLKEELEYIPPKNGRRQYLSCRQCGGEYPCRKRNELN